MACILILSIQSCLGVPPITLISVFSHLPLLRTLRILGVPRAAIPSIMACLPNLIALDTDYEPHGNYHSPSTPLPRLQQLMIRVNSVDASGVDELWNWTCSLIPHEGSLQSFSLVTFEIVVPLSFVTRLIRRHGLSLTQFCVVAQVTPEVLTYLCCECPDLALLKCSVPMVDMVRQVLTIPSALTNRLLANDYKSYRTRQEPSYTPVSHVDPRWCCGYGSIWEL